VGDKADRGLAVQFGEGESLAAEEGMGGPAEEAEVLAEKAAIPKAGAVFVDKADAEGSAARIDRFDRLAAGHDVDRKGRGRVRAMKFVERGVQKRADHVARHGDRDVAANLVLD